MKNRERILDAAHNLLTTDGEAVSVDSIAAAAQVSKVTLYNHFESKDEVVVEVIKNELTAIHTQALQSFERVAAEWGDNLERMLTGICHAWIADVRSSSFLAIREVALSYLRRIPELGDVWLEIGPRRIHGSVAAHLKPWIDRGVLQIDDMEVALLQLAGLIVSAHVMYAPFGGGPSDEQTTQLVERGVRIFLDTYVNPESQVPAHQGTT